MSAATVIETTSPETETWTPERAASNGAVFLDEQRPGWADEIDPDTLHVEDTCRCVLGQTYGGGEAGRFCATLGALGLSGDRTSHLGFVARNRMDEYPALTDAWKREIAARSRGQS